MDLEFHRPTLVLDETRARRNIARMAAKARASGVRFRPHFKTHQSLEVGAWFRDEGVAAATVSSLSMARAFADGGFDDLTVAFPLNLRELDVARALAGRIALGLLVDSEEAAGALADSLGEPARVWIKVDTGYGRAGVDWRRPERAAALARRIARAPRLALAGLLTHAGHAYRERGADGVRRVHAESVFRMNAVRDALRAEGFRDLEVSVGDTPGCSLAEGFSGVDEIRPGNFVFYDLMQRLLGACADDDIALTVACPVAGRYPDRGQLLLWGGAVHLSEERLEGPDGRTVFGCLGAGEPGNPGGVDETAPLVSLSQEHGVVSAPARLEALAIGDIVPVFPVHACLAANLHGRYRTTGGRTLERIRL